MGELFPELAGIGDLPPGTLLDGELVVLRNGRPDLSLVQSRQQLAELDASFDRRPHVALDLPAAFSRDWPQHLFVDGVATGHDSGQFVSSRFTVTLCRLKWQGIPPGPALSVFPLR